MPVGGWRAHGCIAAAPARAGVPTPALGQTEPAPSVAAEIRSSAGGKLKSFYGARGYWPLWVRNDRLGPEADRLIELVASADLDGLDPDDYDPDDLRAIVAEAGNGSPEALARAEIKLSKTFAEYVRDLRRAPSAKSVKMVYLDSELAPERPSEAAVLRAAAVAPSFGDYMETAGWMSPIYSRLRTALADYRANWSALPEIAIAPGPVLRVGTKGDRVRALRLRLGLPDGATFDKALSRTLRAFQAAHGLPADGVAGNATIAALNRGPVYYERLIRLNLARARVLPDPRTRHIVVDAAAARLWMYEDGKLKDTMRVIVGMPEEPTPMLAGMMRYAIVNPYWNVPMDLVGRRIVPKVRAGASLRKLGFEALSDWSDNARVLEPAEIDWSAVAAGTQPLRVRQLPGKTNAMGKMKFMFPNNLGIYLHDTPEKHLFRKEERRFSSGCVRVEDAPRLAKWLFGKPLKPSSDAPEQHVPLTTPIPVYITYLTAAPDESGIAFRKDAYGRDEVGMRQFASR